MCVIFFYQYGLLFTGLIIYLSHFVEQYAIMDVLNFILRLGEQKVKVDFMCTVFPVFIWIG